MFRQIIAFYRSLKRMTLNKWAETYYQILEAQMIKPSTLKYKKCYTRTILRALGKMPVREIKPIHVARLAREIWNFGHHQNSRRIVIIAREIFNEAINAGVIQTNPATSVKLLPYRVARSRLSFETWQKMAVIAAQSRQRWIAPLLRLALVTGQRRSDLVKMRFDDVWGDYLHIEQVKTGARIALPLALRLNAINVSIGDVVEECRNYSAPGGTLLRKSCGGALVVGMLSMRFHQTLLEALGEPWDAPGTPPSLHEIRSLSERLYRAQGVDTQTLLGHKTQQMTDQYNNDRGLDRDKWKMLVVK